MAGAAVDSIRGSAAAGEEARGGAAAGTGCCVDCRLDGSALFKTVFILDSNLLPTPFPFSSLPSPCVPGTLEVMLMSRAMRCRGSKTTKGEGEKWCRYVTQDLAEAGSGAL